MLLLRDSGVYYSISPDHDLIHSKMFGHSLPPSPGVCAVSPTRQGAGVTRISDNLLWRPLFILTFPIGIIRDLRAEHKAIRLGTTYCCQVVVQGHNRLGITYCCQGCTVTCQTRHNILLLDVHKRLRYTTYCCQMYSTGTYQTKHNILLSDVQ
jgi:hypothetical protein